MILPIFAEMNANKQQIILAPLHGFTDYLFRNVYAQHFNGIDLAISPFISLLPGEKINPVRVKDLFHENNLSLAVVPQILGNDPRLFINMANYLNDMGYDEVNWNLGCPIKKIAHKKRGSGMLPYPELLDELLKQETDDNRRRVWKEARQIRWSNFDSEQYEKVIKNIRASMPNQALWEVEKFWQGHQ